MSTTSEQRRQTQRVAKVYHYYCLLQHYCWTEPSEVFILAEIQALVLDLSIGLKMPASAAEFLELDPTAPHDGKTLVRQYRRVMTDIGIAAKTMR